MSTNWKFSIIIMVIAAILLVISLPFAIKGGIISSTAYTDSSSTFLKTPRQKVCYELIENIKEAYKWDTKISNEASRFSLRAAIQIYNEAGANRFCDTYVFKILEDVKNGE